MNEWRAESSATKKARNNQNVERLWDRDKQSPLYFPSTQCEPQPGSYWMNQKRRTQGIVLGGWGDAAAMKFLTSIRTEITGGRPTSCVAPRDGTMFAK